MLLDTYHSFHRAVRFRGNQIAEHMPSWDNPMIGYLPRRLEPLRSSSNRDSLHFNALDTIDLVYDEVDEKGNPIYTNVNPLHTMHCVPPELHTTLQEMRAKEGGKARTINTGGKSAEIARAPNNTSRYELKIGLSGEPERWTSVPLPARGRGWIGRVAPPLQCGLSDADRSRQLLNDFHQRMRANGRSVHTVLQNAIGSFDWVDEDARITKAVDSNNREDERLRCPQYELSWGNRSGLLMPSLS